MKCRYVEGKYMHFMTANSYTEVTFSKLNGYTLVTPCYG
jgi:translation elongation factor P/translation initiation factor 5A